MGVSVQISFKREKDGRYCYVSIDRYHDPSTIAYNIYEKDDKPIERYTSSDRTFYLMSNINTVTGTWAENDIVMTIGGQLSMEELKSMIDSIGG